MLGRLLEARELFIASERYELAAENSENVARTAINLCTLYLVLGDPMSALAKGAQGVELSGDTSPSARKSRYAIYGEALNQAGRYAEAEAQFTAAEKLQTESSPAHPLMFGLGGFLCTEFRLRDAERAVWYRSLDPEALQSDTIRRSLDEVIVSEEKTKKILGWRAVTDNLMTIGLEHVLYSRILLYRAVLDEHSRTEALIAATENIDIGVERLRQAHATCRYPNGVLTRAWIHALKGENEESISDLAELQYLCERAPMPLFLSDVHLYRARLFFRQDREAARKDLAAARALIEKHQYRRRLPELEDAEAVIGRG
jgi:tetratricopeptide (TPR) repeat protein